MARLRPRRRRAERSTAPASSASSLFCGRGAFSVSGPCARLSNNVLRITFRHWLPRFKSALRVVTRIRAIERFIAEREIGDDISLDRNLKHGPWNPGWIAQMTARDLTRFEPQRNQYVAAETFDQRQPFAAAIGKLDCDGPLRQAIEYLLDQSKTLLDLADANPDACVDVPRGENGNCEIERGVWRIAGRSPRVEIATAGASNKSCGTKSPSDRAVEHPRRSGAVLQRGRVVIKLDQPRKPIANLP